MSWGSFVEAFFDAKTPNGDSSPLVFESSEGRDLSLLAQVVNAFADELTARDDTDIETEEIRGETADMLVSNTWGEARVSGLNAANLLDRSRSRGELRGRHDTILRNLRDRFQDVLEFPPDVIERPSRPPRRDTEEPPELEFPPDFIARPARRKESRDNGETSILASMILGAGTVAGLAGLAVAFEDDEENGHNGQIADIRRRRYRFFRRRGKA